MFLNGHVFISRCIYYNLGPKSLLTFEIDSEQSSLLSESFLNDKHKHINFLNSKIIIFLSSNLQQKIIFEGDGGRSATQLVAIFHVSYW